MDISEERGYRIIRIHQALERGMDLSTLRSEIELSLGQGTNQIVLALHENSYLFSEILAHLVTYYKMITNQGGALWLVQSNQKILYLLETLGLTDMIPVVNNVQELP
jgi:anti-anti-sigma factor